MYSFACAAMGHSPTCLQSVFNDKKINGGQTLEIQKAQKEAGVGGQAVGFPAGAW
jgi:hypothetical protein